jgi:hypothetical protein
MIHELKTICAVSSSLPIPHYSSSRRGWLHVSSLYHPLSTEKAELTTDLVPSSSLLIINKPTTRFVLLAQAAT